MNTDDGVKRLGPYDYAMYAYLVIYGYVLVAHKDGPMAVAVPLELQSVAHLYQEQKSGMIRPSNDSNYQSMTKRSVLIKSINQMNEVKIRKVINALSKSNEWRPKLLNEDKILPYIHKHPGSASLDRT
jgi:hypothetical protein